MLTVNSHLSSFKRLYHKKVLLWLMALSLKACSIWWISAAVFQRQTKFDEDSLLCHINCKKISSSQNLTKTSELNNMSSQLGNWLGVLFTFPEFLGST
jgi:hypothetical protein